MTHVDINRDYWNDYAPEWVAAGKRLWAASTPEWGNWGMPNAQTPMLPGDMTGLDAIELGCGTGYISGWMARLGATVTAIDISKEQLATARALAAKHKADITFIEGNAEETGLPDSSFDFAISEYGAAIWCDPELWLREAFRLLRPGGELAFLGNHPLTIVTAPESGAPSEYKLHRSYRTLGKVDWTGVEIDPSGIEFNRSIAGWFALFHDVGFHVTNYQELYAPAGASGQSFAIMADWAKDYPSEQVWWLKKP